MTLAAVDALTTFQTRMFETARSFTEAEWQAPSASPGWRVQDVIAHLGVGARSMADPIPLPEHSLPAPANREREHDMHVALRSSWSSAEVLDEFETFATQRLAQAPAFAEETTRLERDRDTRPGYLSDARGYQRAGL